jgi:hypothetical protein
VIVSERRTRIDFAHCIKELVDVHYPQAQKIVLVMDNLRAPTHPPPSMKPSLPPKPNVSLIAWRSTTRPNMALG